ncbi:MAG: hypothetical protein WD767_09495 [Alphaproteobacteria bacterium]
MPQPFPFLIAVVILVAGTAVYALITPDARIWIDQFPVEVTVIAGGSATVVAVLAAIALGIGSGARSRRDEAETARIAEARALAAAIQGELTALNQWLIARTEALERLARNQQLGANRSVEELEIPRSAARTVFEANASRLNLLGPDLASATAYCHAAFERAEWQLIATPEFFDRHDIDVLQAISRKLEKTTLYLEAFSAGAVDRIADADRKTIFAPTAIEPGH